jgi:protein HOOK3
MALSKSAQAALLKWVNTFDGLDRKADSLDDLTDGVILAQVLHILNPDFQSSSLNQHAKSWLEKKRNLETVYRALAQFLRQDNPYLAPSPNQFRTIIDNPDPNGMCEVSGHETSRMVLALD